MPGCSESCRCPSETQADSFGHSREPLVSSTDRMRDVVSLNGVHGEREIDVDARNAFAHLDSAFDEFFFWLEQLLVL